MHKERWPDLPESCETHNEWIDFFSIGRIGSINAPPALSRRFRIALGSLVAQLTWTVILEYRPSDGLRKFANKIANRSIAVHNLPFAKGYEGFAGSWWLRPSRPSADCNRAALSQPDNFDQLPIRFVSIVYKKYGLAGIDDRLFWR
jgi:hypothetical protein